MFEGRDRATGELKWTGTRVDLVFGSNSQLRALAEVYACEGAEAKFVQRLRRGVDQGDEPGPLRSRLRRETRGRGSRRARGDPRSRRIDLTRLPVCYDDPDNRIGADRIAAEPPNLQSAARTPHLCPDSGFVVSNSKLFSKLFPNISKLFAWILQTFPNIFSCVLSLFKGLRGAQEPIFYFQAFSPGRTPETGHDLPFPRRDAAPIRSDKPKDQPSTDSDF